MRYPGQVAIEVSLTLDGIGAVYTSSGVLTGQDLLDADARVREEARRNPGFRYVFVDHSAIPEEKIDTESLQVLAERTSETLELIPAGMVAIAAPSDVLFGLSRMWETQAEQPGLVTFVARTRDEAVAWLKEKLSQRQLPFRLTE